MIEQFNDISTQILRETAAFADNLAILVKRLRATAKGLYTENERLRKALETDEQLLDRRNQVIDAIPPCPEHGPQCLPHCLDWLEDIQTENRRLRVERNRIFCAAQRVAFLVNNTPQIDEKLTRLNDELIGVLRMIVEGNDDI